MKIKDGLVISIIYLPIFITFLPEVLKESSVLLTPVDFLNLLPQDGNAQFFLPYIEKSYRHFQTLQLKETIISKGEQLAQSV